MNYTDIKNTLPSLISGNWPAQPDANEYFYVVNPESPPAPVTLQLDSLEKQLTFTTCISGTPFTKLIGNLPDDLKWFKDAISSLRVKELGIAIGTQAEDQTLPISAFNFTLAIDFEAPPTVCGFELTEIGLELNLVDIGSMFAWNLILIATCTFLGVNCGLSIGLFAPSITLTLSQTEGISVDTILGQASSGINLTSLHQKMGVSSTGDVPKIQFFTATAELGSSPSFSCSLVLDLSTTQLKWKEFSLSSIAIAFERGSGDTEFSFGVSALMGGYDVEGLITYDSAAQTSQFQGSLSTIGSSLKEFWDEFSSQLGIASPISEHWPVDIELSGVSITLNHSPEGFTFDVQCGGSIAFDALGTSLRFQFSFDKQSSNEITVTLQLGSLVFKLDDTSGKLIFSYTGSETLPLTELIYLARIYPLYGITNDIQLILESGVLVFAPTPPTHHILCGLNFSFNATLNNDILKMITGSDQVGITGATLLAANKAWTLDELNEITSPLSLNAPVPEGISAVPNLAIGGTQISTPLVSPNTNNNTNNTGQTSSPPAPQGVNSPSAAHWFNVQKQVGPVYLDRLGIKLDRNVNGSEIDFLCDASFTLGPLTIALNGFSVDVPFQQPIDFSVSLQGMNISYNKPPLLISGGFLHTTDSKGDDLYVGDATIETETLFLSAIGEYARDAQGNTSLALFAALNDPPLGGPVFFFVTGLAAGFGYNSKLSIPTDASGVASFPLILAALPPNSSTGQQPKSPMDIITSCVTPMQGEYWLAFGVLFRSFELLQSTALITATFGHDLQFALLGQSEISIPPAPPASNAEQLAYAQVDILATYCPQSETLEVLGVLDPSSYVLSKDCHLTGGFAYVLKPSGDFVVTFGGYGPKFDYQSHGYPTVAPLQIYWQIDSHTNIKGYGYFAMTPAAMMAGGGLQATWNSGIFSAWFNIGVDLFMQWQPFAYQGDYTMSLGVSFDLRILWWNVHFSFQVGASLSIEGPPFRGKAHIDLGVISFDVSFGPSAGSPPPLLWNEFRKMLPGAPQVDNTESSSNNNTEEDSAILSAKVTGGLIKDVKDQNGLSKLQIVNGMDFSIEIQSSIPVTTLLDSDSHSTVTLTPETASIGILPMEIASAEGTLDIKLTDANGNVQTANTDPASLLVVEMIKTDMASAHWATQPVNTNTPPMNLTSGYRIYSGRPNPDRTQPVLVSTLLSQPEKIMLFSDSNRQASDWPFPS